MTKCECPDFSMDHPANGCKKTARYVVIRDGKQISVCGDCTLSSDKQMNVFIPPDKD